jgi:hypothetical protein
MQKIIITKIYNEILEYYKTYPQYYDNYFEQTNQIIVDERAVPIEKTAKDALEANERDFQDLLFSRDIPYINEESFNNKDGKGYERVRRYLTNHFSYLMKNVLYIDMRSIKAEGSKGSFFIYQKDASIIKEILLRSVSQNEMDLIIGQWLDGKIKDNDYDSITELSTRLFGVIKLNKVAEPSVKEQWIETLRYALRTDLAYTMTEIEYTLKEAFSNSLPFSIEQNNDTFNHSYISSSVVNYVNALDENAQKSIVNNIYQYMESVDLEHIMNDIDIPPIELLKLKCVCEYICTHKYIMECFPNSNKFKSAIKYFLSVDRDFNVKLKNRKIYDKNRYENKKSQK